jgi:integrase
MPKRAVELKVKQIEAMRAPGLYAVGGVPGLHLQISEGGGRSWIYRFQLADRRRDMGLGGTDIYNLAAARERAREARKLIDQGIDPIDQRKAEKQTRVIAKASAMTFRQCAEAYIKAHQTAWKNAVHAAQWPSTLAMYVYPSFGSVPVQAVDVGHVMKSLDPIWTEKPETASRVRGRIESVLDWAKARGFRTGENPARWRGHLENLLPARSKIRRVEHHAALPYPELGAFMTGLRQQEGMAARALEFAILTAARTGEVIGARWAEINMAERVWTIPAERMKAGKEHRVPLSNAAMMIVEAMAEIRSSDYVFAGVSDRTSPVQYDHADVAAPNGP